MPTVNRTLLTMQILLVIFLATTASSSGRDNLVEIDDLNDASKSVVKFVIDKELWLLNINIESSNGARLSTITLSPSSLVMSLVSLLMHLIAGKGSGLLLLMGQVLNG